MRWSRASGWTALAALLLLLALAAVASSPVQAAAGSSGVATRLAALSSRHVQQQQQLRAELAREYAPVLSLLDASASLGAEVDSDAEAEAEAELEAQVDAEGDVALEGEVEAETEAEAEAELDSELEAELDGASETELESQLDADSELDAEAEAEAEVDSEAEAEVEAEAEAEVDASASVPATTSIAKLKAGYQTYGHGAVMGASNEFAQSEQWMGILRAVWPAEFGEVDQLAQKVRAATSASRRAAAIGALMLRLENNPVLAAYGATQHLAQCAGNAEASPSACPSDPLKTEWDVWTDPAAPANLNSMRVSHGNQLTTVAQSVLSSSTVGWSRPEVKGGPTALQWLEYFGRAVNLARKSPDQSFSAADAVQLGASYLRAPGGGLILDVKSTYSSSGDIDALVGALRSKYRINVIGVGSFVREQVDGLRSGNLLAVHFFHSHWGVLDAIEAGVMRTGDFVMFNAGSLLNDVRAGSRTAYSVDASAVSELAAAAKSKQLRLALYVQEPGTSPEAANALVSLANSNRGVFTDGFAWGHVNGRADANVVGNGQGSQSSLALLDRTKLATNRAGRRVKGWFKK